MLLHCNAYCRINGFLFIVIVVGGGGGVGVTIIIIINNVFFLSMSSSSLLLLLLLLMLLLLMVLLLLMMIYLGAITRSVLCHSYCMYDFKCWRSSFQVRHVWSFFYSTGMYITGWTQKSSICILSIALRTLLLHPTV